MVAAFKLLFYHSEMSQQRLREGNRAAGETESASCVQSEVCSERVCVVLDVSKLINKFCFEERYFPQSIAHVGLKVTHSPVILPAGFQAHEMFNTVP